MFGLAGPVLGFIGDMINSNNQADAQDQNIQVQTAHHAQEQQMAYDFAKHGIQMRVEDARRAGINVNAALGVQGAQGPGFSMFQPAQSTGGFGSALSNLGQSLSVYMNQQDMMELEKEKAQAQIKLDNAQADLLRSQTSNPRSPGRQTHLPNAAGNLVPSQGNSGQVVTKPSEVITADRYKRNQSPGVISEVGFSRLGDGSYAPIMSSDFKQRSEDSLLPEAEWFFRNRLAVWSKGPGSPGGDVADPGPGRRWAWKAGTQSYHSVPIDYEGDMDLDSRLKGRFNKRYPKWRR